MAHLLFWLLISLRGQGDQAIQGLVATSATPSSLAEQTIQQSAIVAVASERASLGGLLDDYLAVFGILAASVILALRRRARLVFGQRHRGR